jgi:hypothetical protein
MGFNSNKFFAGLGKAPITGRGAFLPYADAMYTGTIERMLIADRSGSFVVELNVETSTHPDVKPGDRRTWIQSTKDEDIALGAMAGFAVAMMGVNANNRNELAEYQDYAEAFIATAVSEDNPLHGEPFSVRTVAHKTKKNGGDFTIHNWQVPVNGRGPSEWAALLQPVLDDMRSREEPKARPAPATAARIAPRAPAPPPPPPPPAAHPWTGRPVQNGHYLDAASNSWVLLPAGVTG